MNDSPQLQRVEQAVLAMPMARTLGLRFTQLAAGEVEIELPITEALSFSPGRLQATAVFAAADFAAVRARGRVVHGGQLLTVCAAEVYAVAPEGGETLCATLLVTARNIRPD